MVQKVRKRYPCSVESCNNLGVGGVKFCSKHYQRMRKYGDPNYPVKESEKHGRSHTPEYNSWHSMIQRCGNKNDNAYSEYGARGIRVCDRWRNSFTAFYEDMGDRPSPTHSIERLNNDGNYEPGNCKWATKTEQILNRRVNKNNTSGFRGVSFDKKKG